MKEFTSDEKLGILLEFLAQTSAAEELCQCYGITRKTLYNWHDRLRDSASLIFCRQRTDPQQTRLNLKKADLDSENAALQIRLNQREGMPAPTDDEDEHKFAELLGVNEVFLERREREDDERKTIKAKEHKERSKREAKEFKRQKKETRKERRQRLENRKPRELQKKEPTNRGRKSLERTLAENLRRKQEREGGSGVGMLVINTTISHA